MPQTTKMRILRTSRINRYMIELIDPSSWVLSVQVKTKCATSARMFVLVVKPFSCFLVIIQLFFPSNFRADFSEVSLTKI